MTEQEWRDRYALRIMHVTSCSEDDARAAAAQVDLSSDVVYDIETDRPEDAADDELSYWSDDGDKGVVTATVEHDAQGNRKTTMLPGHEWE